MKASQLFWGFFFITFGALYLVGRYTVFIIDWYSVWDMWPLIIILAGVAIILKGTFVKPIVSVLFGVLLAFLAFGFFNDVFDIFEDRDYHKRHFREVSENTYSVDYNKTIKHVNLQIDAGAGKFSIEKTTDNLVKGYSKGSVAGYSFNNSQKDSIAWVDVKMDNVEHNIFGTNFRNDFKLNLNENPTWSLELNIGAAKSYFNLIPFKIKNLVVHTGATNTKIKLGNKTEMTYVNVEIGAAALTIYVPKSSGCKVTGDMILMSKEFRGFKKLDSDYYVTQDYENKDHKVIIDIEGGVSSFEVKRY